MLVSSQLYSLRSCQVPQSKVHQKLVHATHVIIALLREKEQLVQQAKEVKGQPTVPRTNAQTQTELPVSTEQVVQTEPPVASVRGSPQSVEQPVGDFPLPSGEFPPLQFTDSSLGSIDNVLAMVEQELSDGDTPRHTSTPTGPHTQTHPQPTGKLELVGQKAHGSVRPGPKVKGQLRKPQVKRTKKLVRNYNIKD